MSEFPSFFRNRKQTLRQNNLVIRSEFIKILDINQYQKSDKAPFGICRDLQYLIDKTDGFKNNFKSSSTTKVSGPIASGFSMHTILSFKSIENQHDVYRGKYCMKKKIVNP